MAKPKRHSDKSHAKEPTAGESIVAELPGSAMLASTIERRQFLRKAANAVFFTVAGTMVGSVALAKSALADPSKASAQGPCCPACCGPSPCCNTSCCDKPCCAQDSTTCANNGPCLGPDYRDYSSGCWSCVYSRVVTTCWSWRWRVVTRRTNVQEGQCLSGLCC